MPVTKADSFSLLCTVGSEREAGALAAAFLLRFDTDNGRLVLCDLPPETVLLDSGMPRTAAEIYRDRGGRGVCETFCTTMDTALGGWADFRAEAFRSLVDELGVFDYDLTEDVSVTSAEGIVTYSKHAGHTVFGGNDTIKLLSYTGLAGPQRVLQRETLGAAALASFAGTEFGSELCVLYEGCVNSIATDLSSADAYTLMKAGNAVASDRGTDVQVFRLGGSWSADGRFELSVDVRARYTLYFPG